MIDVTATIPRTIVYEDFGWRQWLPLVYLRPVFDLRCGMGSLLDRIAAVRQQSANSRMRPDAGPIGLWCRPLLAESMRQFRSNPVNVPTHEAVLLLNGRARWNRLPECEPRGESWVGTCGGDARIACVFADESLSNRLSPEVLLDEARCLELLANVPRRDVSSSAEMFDWPWQLIHANARAIANDWKSPTCEERGHWGLVDRGSHLLNRPSIHVGLHSRIKPCVVIDAEKGPVWIGTNVTIQPHSYIEGPAVVGDGSLIQPGAVVHAGTSIGPRCKVGGEIESSIIQGFSNKQHDGFLGHSFIGSWVNIAADCINSDLKNTYGTVRVPINGVDVDSGERFVGMLAGDHSKMGINVSFPTGAVIGFCSSVFTTRSPKFVPSFSWVDNGTINDFDIHRGIEIARTVMQRRDRDLTDAEEQLFYAAKEVACGVETRPAPHPTSTHSC